MRIVICDDDPIFANEIKLNVARILSERRIPTNLDTLTNSKDAYDCNTFYDIAFLDIEMLPYSGIEIAKKLKEINPYIIVFIITSYDKYLDDAMDLKSPSITGDSKTELLKLLNKLTAMS